MIERSRKCRPARKQYASLAILAASLGVQPVATATLLNAVIAQPQTQDQILQPCRDRLQNNQFEQAFLACETARNQFLETGDRSGEMRALSNMAFAATELGKYDQALALHQQSLTLAQQLKIPKNQAVSLQNLATLYLNRGQSTQAIEHYRQSIDLSRAVPDSQLEINDLIGLGAAYQGQQAYSQAIDTYEQSINLARQLQNPLLEASALDSLATVYDLKGDYDKAISLHQQAIAIFQRQKDSRSEAQAKYNLGLIYAAQGQYDQAIDLYKKYLTLARQLKLPQSEALALGSLADVYVELGQYPKAMELHQQQLDIAIALQAPNLGAAALNGMGLAQDGLGDYQQAIAFHGQALDLYIQLEDSLGQAQSLNNLGSIYSSLGQYVTALQLHGQQLQLLQSIEAPTETAKALQNQGNIYNRLGQLDKATGFYHEALTQFQALGEQPAEARILGNLGGLAIQKEQWQTAKKLYQQQLKIAQAIDNPLLQASAFGSLGLVHEGLVDPIAAAEAYQQQLTIAEDQGNRAQAATALTNLGALAHNQGQYDNAQALHRQALALRQALGDRLGQSKNLSNIATTAFRQGNLETAETFQAQAIEKLEAVRDRNLEDASKISLLETYRRNYAQYQQILIAQGKPEQALEISEQGRARAFVELFSDRTASDPTARLSIEPPNLADLKRIAQNQQATLVEYSIINTGIGNPSLYTWVIQPSGQISFHQTDLNQLDQPFEQLIQTSRNSLGIRGRAGIAIAAPGRLSSSERKRQTMQKLQQLHQLLIEPIADQLPQDPNQAVIFIPQDELFLVPFPALRNAQGNYLIEQYSTLTAPSIQALDLTHQQSQRLGSSTPQHFTPNDMLIVGNPTMPSIYNPQTEANTPLLPLLGAEQEARLIAQQLGTQPLLNADATEASVKERLGKAKLIHLATHGLLDYGNPQLSGVDDLPGAIALAPSNSPNAQEDGLLTTHELLELDLHADLVVLSACDTGRGDLMADGVIGLSRSLMTAGVPSVIVSLWQVPDESTAFLMTEFYKQWLASDNKAQALRQAMLMTLEQYPDPIHWSAFTLIGQS